MTRKQQLINEIADLIVERLDELNLKIFEEKFKTSPQISSQLKLKISDPIAEYMQKIFSNFFANPVKVNAGPVETGRQGLVFKWTFSFSKAEGSSYTKPFLEKRLSFTLDTKSTEPNLKDFGRSLWFLLIEAQKDSRNIVRSDAGYMDNVRRSIVDYASNIFMQNQDIISQ